MEPLLLCWVCLLYDFRFSIVKFLESEKISQEIIKIKVLSALHLAFTILGITKKDGIQSQDIKLPHESTNTQHQKDACIVFPYQFNSSSIAAATLSALGNIAASRLMFMGTAGKSSAPMV